MAPIQASHSKRDLFVAAMPVDDNGRLIIKKLLIANRGEIACRVIRTCREVGVISVAVYTEADKGSLYVEQADESICIGPVEQPAGNPHQNISLLIESALSVNADSIHPGYGYLSENAEFAEQVIAAGLRFVGPTPHAISVLGDKRTAKAVLLEQAPSVPLIPGYWGSEQDAQTLIGEAAKIGYPVMIKASAGGGGKGMRIVHDAGKIQEELSRAQSEAQKSFGSSDCILEKYIEKGKHIEVQIFGDKHGNVVSLFERECSIQRRHQKVIEESPSPWVSQELRQMICSVAVDIGNLLHYEGAGTVEFMVDVLSSRFYFLEVNTRIQVEHPITEEVSAIDLVALQLYVAAGGNLNDVDELKDLSQQGHAIECRLCAEDPNRGFVPDLGTIWRWNTANEVLPAIPFGGVRYETSLRTGSEISIYFDSMIAKVIVWAPTRPLAIRKMLLVMANTVCIGPRTNQLFLQSCLNHPRFQKLDYTTNFIPDYLNDLLRNPYVTDSAAFVKSIAVVPSLLLRNIDVQSANTPTTRPFPSIRRGFRNQSADASSRHADIVSIRGIKEPFSKFLIVLPSERDNSSSSPHVTYTIQEVIAPPHEDPDFSPSTKLGTGANLAHEFSRIRTLLHNRKVQTKMLEVCKFERGNFASQAPSRTSLLADLVMVIDGEKRSAYLATDTTFSTSDNGAPNRVFVHMPLLGTNVEFLRYTLLAHQESLGSSIVTEDQHTEKFSKAPMPCKVLRVLKNAGDVVRKGEVLIVIESMKMEMKVIADFDGTFECKVAVGDAVQEGTVLCNVI